MVLGIEHHIDLIAECIQHVERNGLRTIEPTPEAQEQWAEHVASMVEGSVRTAPSCNSWYVGANVPGKKRVHMAYTGGFPKYRRECAEIVEAGYRGFRFG
jgi:cyclohexanone monooxygenase